MTILSVPEGVAVIADHCICYDRVKSNFRRSFTAPTRNFLAGQFIGENSEVRQMHNDGKERIDLMTAC